MALTSCVARSAGFWLSFFASSKHNDEASCPNSGFGGLLNVKFSILTSGTVHTITKEEVENYQFEDVRI